MDRLHRSVRASLTGLAVNILLAASKLAAGWFGHSHALVADAVESLADSVSSLIVWRGMVVAETPADAEHPYGHGKAEPLAAAFVSTGLLLAAAWIAVTSVREIIQPHLRPAPFTLAVLISVVVIKETLFRYIKAEARAVNSSAVLADAWHHRSDAITSLAAGIGISIAVFGGPAFAMADDIAALVASGLIAWNGWRLLRPALDELMDTAPPPAIEARVRSIARDVRGVEDVEKCVVRKMGVHYYVDMHIEVAPEMTVRRAHAIAHAVKDQVRAAMPTVVDVLVHVEPCPADKTERRWT